MEWGDNSIQHKETNSFLKGQFANINELKSYLRVKYGDWGAVALAGGISKGRVFQIINGFDLPKTQKLIKQLANGWGIDAVNLALIFENGRRN